MSYDVFCFEDIYSTSRYVVVKSIVIAGPMFRGNHQIVDVPFKSGSLLNT